MRHKVRRHHVHGGMGTHTTSRRRILAVVVIVAGIAFGLGGLSGWVVRALTTAEKVSAPDTTLVTARNFRVIRVIDGNTFEIQYDGEPTLARLDAVDAPLLSEPGGQEAREALAHWIEKRTVRIIFPAERKRDAQGRLVVRVKLKDDDLTDVGEKLRQREQPTTRP